MNKKVCELLRSLDTCQSSNVLSAGKLSALRITLSHIQHKHESKVVPGMQHMHELQQSLEILSSIVMRALDKVSNYFGDYDESIYAAELNRMADCLHMLVVSAYSMQPANAEYNLLDGFTSHMLLTDEGDGAVEEEIRCCCYLYLKVFWIHHFHWAAVIEWMPFRCIFEEIYGIQHDYAMNIFYQAICGEKSAATTASISARRVSFDQLQSLFAASVGPDDDINYNATLFDVYQIHANQDSMVLVSGFLIRRSLQFSPPIPIVRELLGLVIQQVACGSQHICVLTSTGQLYSWGEGEYGKLGHGDEEDQICPKLLEFSKSVPLAHVGCGSHHTGAVSRMGQLFTLGEGDCGKLGLGNEWDRHYPSLVQGLHTEQVKSFYAGSYHSCALTSKGHVYSFGKASHAGHMIAGLEMKDAADDNEGEGVFVPKQLDIFAQHPAMQVAISLDGDHTVVLTMDGKAFAWGFNQFGQLGLPNEGDRVYMPREVSGLPARIKQVAVGCWHSCLLSDNGELFVCGYNRKGQLGSPSSLHKSRNAWQRSFHALQCPELKGKLIQEVACEKEHTAILSDACDVDGMGCDPRHRMVYQYLQEQKREVLQMACGSDCSAFVLGGKKLTTLRKLSSDIIRSHAELRHLILGNASAEQLRQQGISHDYAEIVRSMLV